MEKPFSCIFGIVTVLLFAIIHVVTSTPVLLPECIQFWPSIILDLAQPSNFDCGTSLIDHACTIEAPLGALPPALDGLSSSLLALSSLPDLRKALATQDAASLHSSIIDVLIEFMDDLLLQNLLKEDARMIAEKLMSSSTNLDGMVLDYAHGVLNVLMDALKDFSRRSPKEIASVITSLTTWWGRLDTCLLQHRSMLEVRMMKEAGYQLRKAEGHWQSALDRCILAEASLDGKQQDSMQQQQLGPILREMMVHANAWFASVEASSQEIALVYKGFRGKVCNHAKLHRTILTLRAKVLEIARHASTRAPAMAKRIKQSVNEDDLQSFVAQLDKVLMSIFGVLPWAEYGRDQSMVRFALKDLPRLNYLPFIVYSVFANYKPTISAKEGLMGLHDGYNSTTFSRDRCSTRVLGVCLSGSGSASSLSSDMKVIQEAVYKAGRLAEEVMLRSKPDESQNDKKKGERKILVEEEEEEEEDEGFCQSYTLLLHGDWEEDEEGEQRLSLTDAEARNLRLIPSAVKRKVDELKYMSQRYRWLANDVIRQGVATMVQAKMLRIVRWGLFVVGAICGLSMLCFCACLSKLRRVIVGRTNPPSPSASVPAAGKVDKSQENNNNNAKKNKKKKR